MPAKVVLILALVVAAAVLVPLRRAQKAFPVRSEVAGFVATPRVSMRRRPTGQRAVPRVPGEAARRSHPEMPAVAAGGVVEAGRYSSKISQVGRLVSGKLAAAGSHSVTRRPGAACVGDDSGYDQIPHHVDRVGGLDRLATVCAPPSPAVAMRPAIDVPVPPPKQAA